VTLPAVLASALALAACAPGPTTVAGFRQPDAPIWSAAAFAPGQIAGDWRQVAGFAATSGGCDTGALSFTPAADGISVKGTLCLDGKVQPIDAVARSAGPGRLTLAGQEDWWILWVDSGYRTLAIGTPSGRFGFVLDRAALPADRLTAAREVFDFNGYAAAALRPF
jgi:apolipoprotein D and lipocalin family protein